MPPKRKAATKSAETKSTRGTTKALQDEQINPSTLTVAKLREALEEKGLETTGRKPELVERLTEALEDQTNSTAPKSKKAKKEPEQTEFQKAKEILQAQDATNKTQKKSQSSRKVDSSVPFSSNYQVVEDYDCMLNQTNLGHNNNKYYVIQMLKAGSHYHVWTRWGRVGESGQNTLKGPFLKMDAAEKEFTKKFKDKTKNNWDDRDSFVAAAGKYTLLEMADSGDEEVAMDISSTDSKPKKIKNCTLDKTTQGLIKLIFDNDMFNNAMKNFDIDVKKMPLGKISKGQIAKGFDALEEIEKVLNSKKTAKLPELTSDFYTVIPHDFGRQRPPVINNAEALQQKKDMLMVLGDIEVALSMQKDKDKGHSDLETVPHPHDVNYDLLKTDLELVEPSSELYKILADYTNNTKSTYSFYSGGGGPTIQNIWKVNRHSASARYKQHEKVENRKLLWHGTNVAVVAAILKDGLRIMPHSGGRVGRGIYFASEQMKSAGYVRPSNDRIGIMFLNEVALGNEHTITRDDSSLVKAPSGYDSVVARGTTEPDVKMDTKIELDGHDVCVPQGKAVHISKYSNSSFGQSEYLIYKESQNRIRFLLTFKF
eukprot:TRINITY_DN2107_c0_g1_i1.p1 TRINITY_DN2107_c0_g1~~TRINITY_DN2107_c0_g1_i1.p1  ORF type:complete len:597 (+),score=136.95 TRINITY_DN2107_c0_g1_i1:61-1851(+)